MKCRCRPARAGVLAALACALGLAGCTLEQQRPPQGIALPSGVSPQRPGPVFVLHPVVARTLRQPVAQAYPSRLAPAVAASPVAAAGRVHTAEPVGLPRRASPPAMVAGERTRPAEPRAPVLQAISLKENRLAPESGYMRAPRTLGEVEAAAVRYAGGSCTSAIYRMAWDAAQLFDIEPAVVAAVIEIESGCHANAVSTVGARGLMQLMPAFGARDGYRLVYGVDHEPSVNELGNPAVNIRLGVAYLGMLRDHYAYIDSSRSRLLLVVASYNCGLDFLDQRLPAESIRWKAEQAAQWIAGHVPNETRAFVVAVLDRAARYHSAIVTAHASAAAGSQIGSH